MTDDGPDEGPGAGPQSVAGAVVCWRAARDRRNGGPDVLLRRLGATRADGPGVAVRGDAVRGDATAGTGWRLPAALPEPGETMPQTAVRALGALARGPDGTPGLRLGRPLDAGDDAGDDAEGGDGADAGEDAAPARYWAARIRDRFLAARETYSGDLVWMSAKEARDLVPGTDRRAVDRLIAYAQDDELETRPALLLRHAKARPRARWSHADAERPLVEVGRAQAAALAGLLECWYPEYLLSSPWQRCTETLRPYAARYGLRVRTKGGLTEATHRTSPGKAVGHLHKILGRDEAALLCTHRPVLATVLAELTDRTAKPARGGIPAQDPFLSPGEVLVAHVAARPTSRSSSIVAIERHRPAA